MLISTSFDKFAAWFSVLPTEYPTNDGCSTRTQCYQQFSFCESVSKFKPREQKRIKAMKERRFYDYFSIVCWIYEIYFNFVKFIVIYSNYINHQYLAHSHIRNMYLMQSLLYIRLRYTYIICKIMSRFAFKFSLNCVYGFVSYSLCRCLCSLCKCFFVVSFLWVAICFGSNFAFNVNDYLLELQFVCVCVFFSFNFLVFIVSEIILVILISWYFSSISV